MRTKTNEENGSLELERNHEIENNRVYMLKRKEERGHFQPEEFCTKRIKHCSVFESNLVINQFSFCSRFIRYERVASSCADATHVLLVSGHLNITFISPVGWPAKNKWFISFSERQRAFDHRTYSWQCSILVGLWRDRWQLHNQQQEHHDRVLPMNIEDPNRHLNEQEHRVNYGSIRTVIQRARA